MDNTQKFDLSDASAEDMQAFKEGIESLLTNLSLNLSIVINKKAVAIKTDDGKVENAFIDQPSLLVQKKTPTAPEIKDAEVVEGAVPSTNPEVNPTL